jgi:dihydroorotate dehydrogenase
MMEEKIMTQAVINKNSTHPLAVISLVLSILGFMPVLPVIGFVAGIITGYIARKNIAANPAFYSGDGLAKAGIVLGWIGVALLVLAVAGLVLFLSPLTFTTVQQAIPVHP